MQASDQQYNIRFLNKSITDSAHNKSDSNAGLLAGNVADKDEVGIIPDKQGASGNNQLNNFDSGTDDFMRPRSHNADVQPMQKGPLRESGSMVRAPAAVHPAINEAGQLIDREPPKTAEHGKRARVRTQVRQSKNKDSD